MRKLQKNQTGFGAVEGVLILIIVGLIGFIGWYVWHAKSQTDKSLNAAASTSANTKAAAKKTDTSTATSSPTTAKSAQSYITITQWGVKLPVSGSLDQATYQDITNLYGNEDIHGNIVSTMEFSPSDTSAANLCKGGTIGWVVRYPDSDSQDQGAIYTHIGAYNYVYQKVQDCTASDASGLLLQFKQAVGQMVAA